MTFKYLKDDVDEDLLDEIVDYDSVSTTKRLKQKDEFSFMQETVDSICKSLVEDFNKWIIDSSTFHKIGTDVKLQHNYVCLFKDPAITCIWNGSSYEKVFSEDQGKQIRKAFNFARDKQASISQKKLINTFK